MSNQHSILIPQPAWLGQNYRRLGLAMLLMLLLPRSVSAELVSRKISGPMPAFGDVSSMPSFQISPDGQTVVYVADPQTDEAFELYSVPLAGGGTPVRLSGLLPSGTSIGSFAIAPDSSRVVYTAAQDTAGVREVYSVPLAGAAANKLNGTLVSGGGVFSFQFSPDSSRVVYRADQQTDEAFELFVSYDESKIHLPLIIK